MESISVLMYSCAGISLFVEVFRMTFQTVVYSRSLWSQ